MKKNNSILLSAPYIAWMSAFTLIPLGVVVYYAFTDPATGAFTFENMNALSAYVPVLWDSICYALEWTVKLLMVSLLWALMI